ncbi:Ig-like domain-containing protein [Thiohalomonas denitrificans]|uniref:hypothetical protein n=1 Tax=Thiohalomonas denitrificans TaxID=415747 RepID=UPI00111414CC|nr:hypothetical protein [Thiohalomonas denitrificans]
MLLLLVVSSSFAFSPPLTNIKVKVVDESGVPVSDARVGATYYGAIDFDSDVEITDEEGVATVSGRSVYAVPFSVSKPGYYPGGKKVMPWEAVNGKEVFRDREVTIMLREKRNPIPLYAIKYSGEIPVAEKWIGFDLQKADWVSPYGNGVIGDFLFRYEGAFRNIDDAYGELRVRFSNEDDGAKTIKYIYPDSLFKVPYEAPVLGYDIKEKLWKQGFGLKRAVKPSRIKKYFFRIRTTQDEDGNVGNALYGKMYGDVRFSLRSVRGGVSRVEFTYYLNSVENDRNLEFALGQSLFGDLGNDNQVREP